MDAPTDPQPDHSTDAGREQGGNALLAAIVAALGRGDCPDEKWPDAKGEYWALCPFHEDEHSGSFSVSARGYHCFSCDAQGDLEKLAEHLGVYNNYCTSACTAVGVGARFSLAAYAEAKQLPETFLHDLGVYERRLQGETLLRYGWK